MQTQTVDLVSDAEALEELHRQALVIDGLNCSKTDRAGLARFIEGGISAVNITAATPYNRFEPAVMQIAARGAEIRENSDLAVLALSSQDVLEAKESGRVAVILGLQNALPVEGSLLLVDVLWRLGIRVMQLTYNERNAFGDGCVQPGNAGLSKYGFELVETMNRTGMLIDLSHCSHRTTLDAVEASAVPVAITHANAYALCPSPRNKPDEVMTAVAQAGGVVCPVTWGPAVRFDPRPDIASFLDHVDHAIQLVGPDHVGIATDYSEGVYGSPESWAYLSRNGTYPEVTGLAGDWYEFETRHVSDLPSVTKMSRLTAGLARRGYSHDVVRAVLGGNYLRVCEAAWQARGVD